MNGSSYSGQSKNWLTRLISGTEIFILLIWTIGAVVPFLWLILSAFKNRTAIMSPVPKLLFSPTLDNFYQAFFVGEFGFYFWNSLIIALGNVVLCLVVGVPAAYAFSRFDVFGEKHIYFYILTTRMAPAVALALPIYMLFNYVGIIGTRTAVILAHTAFNVAMVVYLMKNFFDDIPIEIDQAALVDGADEFQVFYKCILPVAKPGIATSAIMAFIFSWNEFLFALILGGTEARTLPAAFPGLVTALGTYWGQLAAASTVVTIPVIFLAWSIQGQLTRGLTLGAVD